MQAFVTGATGFVGAHLVRTLLERGDRVRCLVRESSRRDNLDGLQAELCTGDLTDGDSLRRGIEGCDVVYHCAADYRLYVRDPRTMYAANVDGTNNVMQAASDCGVGRVVYTSTVGALGLAPDDEAAIEETPVDRSAMIGHYKKSKFDAERVVEQWAERGLPVVLVHPTAPIGDLDIKPTATGQMIVDFLNGKMVAYVETGLNLIDVRDVAIGHVMAAERGRIGEKYILGHRNLSLKQILDLLAGLTGLKAPRVKLPHWVPITVAAMDTFFSRRLGRTPRLALDAVKLSRYKMYFDAAKAVQELGLPQTPVEHALRRAVHWFRQNGYVNPRGKADSAA